MTDNSNVLETSSCSFGALLVLYASKAPFLKFQNPDCHYSRLPRIPLIHTRVFT